MEGRRIKTVVRSEDVVPTVLDMIGRPAPNGLDGRSLVPLMIGATGDLNLDAYSESLYARNHYGWSELRALRSGRFKYIAAPQPELYDLERDPGEVTNLYSERRQLADRMAAALQKIGAEDSSAEKGPSAVDPETRERLAALGYIGTFTHTSPQNDVALADPKEKIDIFNLMTTAQESNRETGDSTIDRLRKVLSMDPDILDAWVMLGNEYFRRREYRLALEQFQRALAIRPDYDLATINLANTYRALGDHNAALVGYQRYLQKDPKNAWVRYQMGELLVDLNQLEKAETAFEQSLIDDTRVAAARNALGVVAFRRGDLSKAEREIRAAIAQKPDVRLAHYNLALVAERRGDVQSAIREYRTEIDTQANAFKAAFNLAKLYEQLGNAAEQEAAYKKAIELNPVFAEGYFYLAKLYLDQGRNFDEAVELAKRGLQIDAQSEYAPLGHYVLADLYNRRGQRAEAQRELERGRAREGAARARRPGG
jgi:tetratricopeptide (TPR) repeat protein